MKKGGKGEASEKLMKEKRAKDIWSSLPNFW